MNEYLNTNVPDHLAIFNLRNSRAFVDFRISACDNCDCCGKNKWTFIVSNFTNYTRHELTIRPHNTVLD